MVRQAGPRVSLHPVDGPVCAAVSQQHAAQHGRRPAPASAARREESFSETVERVSNRLVDRTPQVDLVSQRIDHLRRKAREIVADERVLPAAQLTEPHGIREMVQRDHRFEPTLAQQADHLPVLCQRLGIELTGPGLDAAPFDRDAQAVQPQLGRAIEVGRSGLQVPPVRGPAAYLSAGDAAGLLLPQGPVVGAVVAFVLVRSRRRTPAETIRKAQDTVHSSITSWPARYPSHR